MLRAAALLGLTLFLGCASAPAGGVRQQSDVILPDEIAASDGQTALELVERLRPRWLVARPERSTRLETVILVYLDNARLGGLEMLRDIRRPMIHSIRVLDAAEAGKLPGLGSQHVQRVIQVATHAR